MGMSVLSACMSAHPMSACPIAHVWYPGIGVVDGCSMPCCFWESNQGPLLEQGLFAAELSLQPLKAKTLLAFVSRKRFRSDLNTRLLAPHREGTGGGSKDPTKSSLVSQGVHCSYLQEIRLEVTYRNMSGSKLARPSMAQAS